MHKLTKKAITYALALVYSEHMSQGYSGKVAAIKMLRHLMMSNGEKPSLFDCVLTVDEALGRNGENVEKILNDEFLAISEMEKATDATNLLK